MAQIITQSSRAAQALAEGKLVGIPTETVYGLGANALLPEAVAEIFAVKHRPAFDPLIIHLARAKSLSDYTSSIPQDFYRLHEHFGAGPLTYILPKGPRIPNIVTAGHDTVAIRFPRHPLAQELLQQLDFPVAAPSANLFGKVSPVTARHVEEQLGESISLILDGGPCSVGMESTIIDLTTALPEVLRMGGIPLEELEEVLGRELPYQQQSSSKPRAPGMLSAHYSPGIPLIHQKRKDLELRTVPENLRVLVWQDYLAQVPESQQRILSPQGNLAEAAAQLFTALRELAQEHPSVIWAEHFPEKGLGRAINDRLRRASVPADF